jgi:hypothetical protein
MNAGIGFAPVNIATDHPVKVASANTTMNRVALAHDTFPIVNATPTPAYEAIATLMYRKSDPLA